MNAAVGRELWVKRRREQMALPDEDRRTIAAGQDFNAGAGFYDLRGANEDHLERATGEGGFGGQNGRIDLAAVGVALEGCVEQAKRALGRVDDIAREQDCSGAGAERGLLLAELLKGLKEAELLEEAEYCGRFAAGQDQPVQASELIGLSNFAWLGAGFGEGVSVSGVIALDGEDTDMRLDGLIQSFS
jgi:hypothetical protein